MGDWKDKSEVQGAKKTGSEVLEPKPQAEGRKIQEKGAPRERKEALQSDNWRAPTAPRSSMLLREERNKKKGTYNLLVQGARVDA